LLQMQLPDNCIVSLSGSNPLHDGAMQWIRSVGKVIFLDTDHSDILSRLSSMKVDRIVGHGADMADNLQYRQQFYEGITNMSNSISCALTCVTKTFVLMLIWYHLYGAALV